MHHILFGPNTNTKFKYCILSNLLDELEMSKEYITPFGINGSDVVAIDLYQDPSRKKTLKRDMKEYLTTYLIDALNDIDAQYLLVTDAEYFKLLTDNTKADTLIGSIQTSPFGPWNVVYVPTYRAIFYDPERTRQKIALSIQAMLDHASGSYNAPGKGIIKEAHYPTTVEDILAWLDKLYHMDRDLTFDIECFSLKHPTAGIGTISFAWDKHHGIAFPVDFLSPEDSKIVRNALKIFFTNFKRKIIAHKITFDAYILIYQLFMEDLIDNEGLLTGLEAMMDNWDCTKTILYLATNSCAGNNLALKDNAYEFAGNYGLGDDIKDITKIPLEQLLEYNLVDSLCTWYLRDRYYPIMIEDEQLEVYNNIFKPAIVDIIQIQLTGLPVNMKTVKKVAKQLQAEEDAAVAKMLSLPIIHNYKKHLDIKWVEKRNEELKVKRVTVDDSKEEFNPNSGPQLQELLYTIEGLPVIETTDSGLPSTGKDTLEALKNHTNKPELLALLDALLEYKLVNKINVSFVPAFLDAFEGPDGWHYVFGNFNIGGTLSGRLSSSEPNLQNIPSGSKYGPILMSCVEAPPGWIFCGLDFNSLEDMISALTTRDPNKIKVYTDGFDGHCLRAQSYYEEDMEGIDPTSVDSINSIESKYPVLRQESKVPTFALTYQGTFRTLMNKCGFTKEKATRIFDRYHSLYRVSTDWINAKLDRASIDGYVTVAFGLRVRTPLLHQVVRGNSKTPYAATAEGRSAGNALGQSWCMLTNRAASEFMGNVRKSKYRNSIKPSVHIHDAQYYMVREDLKAVEYLNVNLVKAVQWQEDPLIAHDTVKLGGKLAIYYPTWDDPIKIPNGAMASDIEAIVNKSLQDRITN